MNEFWRDRRVFVTGCTGLLGSWLTAALVEHGADVVGLVRDGMANSMLVQSGMLHRINVVNGDVADYATMERALAEWEIDTLFHLAAQTIVGIANRAPMSTFETNVKGTWVLLEAARRVGTIKRIVVASSDKAYGDQPVLPYRENVPLQGKHPYDVSKSCADLITQSYTHTYQLPAVVTRFANLYGGGDLNWNRIVPGTIRSVLRGERPIIRTDGTLTRDYLFIPDAVEGYLLVGERAGEAQVAGEAFNFGLNRPISALQMVQTIIAISPHPNLEPIILDQAHNEIQDQFLDATKAHAILGWEPAHDLEEGLRETMAWYKAFLGY